MAPVGYCCIALLWLATRFISFSNFFEGRLVSITIFHALPYSFFTYHTVCMGPGDRLKAWVYLWNSPAVIARHPNSVPTTKLLVSYIEQLDSHVFPGKGCQYPLLSLHSSNPHEFLRLPPWFLNDWITNVQHPHKMLHNSLQCWSCRCKKAVVKSKLPIHIPRRRRAFCIINTDE